jgi:hypothetical protein
MINYTEQQRFDLQFKYHCLNCNSIEEIEWNPPKPFKLGENTYIGKPQVKFSIYRDLKNVSYFSDINFVREFEEYIDFEEYIAGDIDNDIFVDNDDLLRIVLSHICKFREFNILIKRFELPEWALDTYFDRFEKADIIDYQYANISVGFIKKHFEECPEELIIDIRNGNITPKDNRLCNDHTLTRSLYFDENITVLLFWNENNNTIGISEIYYTDKITQPKRESMEVL